MVGHEPMMSGGPGIIGKPLGKTVCPLLTGNPYENESQAAPVDPVVGHPQRGEPSALSGWVLLNGGASGLPEE
jgi:hypothetical protein